MAGSQTIVSGMAGRYASALFTLALDAKSVDKVAQELGEFSEMLTASTDLRRLVESPAFSADEQSRSIDALAKKAKFSALTTNFLGLVTRNRRLPAIKDMISAYRMLAAEHRGEVTADVSSASKLSAAQLKSLETALKSVIGKNVLVNQKVDESLLGGLIVQVGSRMIDSSLRTKLNNLKLAMKEVG
ncbi:MAG: F0F1 ATP synthase subunit delta [Fimbriimonadaceae bacterium]|nr:F0F1 ATP synthase subunit delta [Alphaproteobacteria bacterium]